MSGNRRTYRYYDFVMGAFITVLLCSNIIGTSKLTEIKFFLFGSERSLIFGTGVIFFPFSYIFGDILTEVYGYARARRVVWTGFAALVFASIMSYVVVSSPPATGWNDQKIIESVFGSTPRIALSSLIAFLCGEFANSVVLAKMKVWMSGRQLWMRTIGSTIVGEAIDSLVFYPLAFLGRWPTHVLWTVLVTHYVLKVLNEIIMTPVTYKIVAFLKAKENEDYYDRDTDFTPFSIET